MNFAVALNHLLSGEHIRRQEWDDGINVKINRKNIELFHNYGILPRKAIITSEDVKSDDWEIFHLSPI